MQASWLMKLATLFPNRRLERNNVAHGLTIAQHVHHFDPGPLHFMHKPVHPGGKVTAGDEGWRRNDESSRGREQTLVNAI
jgi:hypothetical protein